MSEYLPKPKYLAGKMKVELDLSNYARKTYLKRAPGVVTWNLAKETDLANLKSDVDKLDIDRLKMYQAV